VKERLIARIVSGELRAGQRIVEQALSEEFNISRAPIREALQALYHEGLVRVVPRRGAFVIDLNDRMLTDVLDIREVLEGLIARWAATRLSSGEIEMAAAGLRLVSERLEESAEVYPTGVFDLHEFLLNAMGDGPLANMRRSIDVFVMIARREGGGVKGRPLIALEEHFAILQAIESQDPIRAEEYMRQHMRRSRAALQ